MKTGFSTLINHALGKSGSYSLNSTKGYAPSGQLMRSLEKRFIRLANKLEARFLNPITRYIKNDAQTLEKRNLAINEQIVTARFGEGAFTYLKTLHTTDFKHLDALQSELQTTQDMMKDLVCKEGSMIANAKALRPDASVNINHLHIKGLSTVQKKIEKLQKKEETLIQKINHEQLNIQNFNRSKDRYSLNEPLSNNKWTKISQDMQKLQTRTKPEIPAALNPRNHQPTLKSTTETSTETLITNREFGMQTHSPVMANAAMQTEPAVFDEEKIEQIQQQLQDLSRSVQSQQSLNKSIDTKQDQTLSQLLAIFKELEGRIAQVTHEARIDRDEQRKIHSLMVSDIQTASKRTQFVGERVDVNYEFMALISSQITALDKKLSEVSQVEDLDSVLDGLTALSAGIGNDIKPISYLDDSLPSLSRTSSLNTIPEEDEGLGNSPSNSPLASTESLLKATNRPFQSVFTLGTPVGTAEETLD